MARTITCRPLTRLGPDDLVLCSGTIRAGTVRAHRQRRERRRFPGRVALLRRVRDRARAEGWSDADMRALLDDNGVAVAEIDGRMDWLPGDWGAPSVDRLRRRAAAALGARSITVLETRGRRVGTDIPLDVVVEAFGAVCDRAADHGLLVHLEYFPWSGIAIVRDRARDRRRRRPRQRRRDGRRLASRTRSRRGRARLRRALRVGARGTGERRRNGAGTTTSAPRPGITVSLPGEGAGNVAGAASRAARAGMRGADRGRGVLRRAGPAGPRRRSRDAAAALRGCSRSRARAVTLKPAFLRYVSPRRRATEDRHAALERRDRSDASRGT